MTDKGRGWGNIAAQIPATLDSLVRENRDRVRIEIASASDLLSLTGTVDADAWPKGTVSEWRIMAIRYGRQSTFHLLGYDAWHGRAWVTSWIEAIDHERGLVRTRNSVYRVLGEVAPDPPDLGLVLYVAAWLRGTELGHFIDVADVFW